MHRHQVRFWSSNGLNCFNFLLIRFNLPMIDLWSFGWQRGEGGEVLISLFCVHGFEIHPCRLVFKNTWIEFGKHKTNIYLVFIITHQKICQITKIWGKNRLANPGSLSKQTSQATKRWKTLSLFMKKIGWPMLYISYWNHSRHGVLKNLRLLFWPSFSTINYRFTTEAI